MYSTFDVCEILNMNHPRLVHWIREDFIKCGYTNWGMGKKASFSKHQLVNLALFKRLVDLSLSRPIAKTIVDKIKIKDDTILARVLRGKREHKHVAPERGITLFVDVSGIAETVMGNARAYSEEKAPF